MRGLPLAAQRAQPLESGSSEENKKSFYVS